MTNREGEIYISYISCYNNYFYSTKNSNFLFAFKFHKNKKYFLKNWRYQYLQELALHIENTYIEPTYTNIYSFPSYSNVYKNLWKSARKVIIYFSFLISYVQWGQYGRGVIWVHRYV